MGYYMKYRITKYNPKLRSYDGKYLIDEWTSFYDFKKTLSKALPLDSYFDTENAYSKVYMRLFRSLRISKLQIQNLEQYLSVNECIQAVNSCGATLSSNQLALLKILHNGYEFEINQFKDIFQLVMRELIWCNMESSDKTATLEFGYDYYTYITCLGIDQTIITYALENGIYIEPF